MSEADKPGTKPLVSVVIAAYKHESYIERCIASIADQSYERLELIVVDDKSPDRTLEVTQETVSKRRGRFERVHVVSNTANRGAHFSLNRGMTMSKGRYVSLMNSDDTYAPGRLSEMIDALESSGAEWGFSRVQTIDDNDKPYFEEPVCHHIYWRPSLAKAALPTISWGLLGYQLAASTGNLVVSKDLAMRLRGFANLKYCHDWDFVLRASFLAEPILVDTPLYNYRVHGTNSFRSLSDVAATETNYCLQTYFRMVMSRRPPNKLAPAPGNWPTLFRPLVQLIGVEHQLDAVYAPYRAHHRTVDQAAA